MGMENPSITREAQMKEKMKVLGTLVVGALTLGAVAAPATHATTATMTAESYPVTLTGAQVGTLELAVGNGARKISCAVASVHGVLSGPSASVTVTPTFSGCSSTGGLPVTVAVNGCTYISAATKVTATTGTSTVTVSCPAGQEIKIRVYSNAANHAAGITTCEYGVPPQGPVPVGEYHLEGAGATRGVRGTINNPTTIKNYVGPKLICGLAAGETGKGNITGTGQAAGETAGGAHVGIFAS
jgi:hypothetical protein